MTRRSVNPAGVNARYMTPAGKFVDATLDLVRPRDLLDGRPVREFRSWKGRRHYSGWWWASTTGTHLAYESLLERACLLHLDADPRVRRIASQPVVLTRTVNGRPRTRIPDFIVEDDAGAVTVIDVKPAVRVDEPKVAASLAWTADAAHARGWNYAVWTGPASRIVHQNLQFLSGYRRDWFLDAAAIDAARAHASPGDTIYTLETRITGHEQLYKLLVRPAILHLLWAGALTTDLTEPLAAGTRLAVTG